MALQYSYSLKWIWTTKITIIIFSVYWPFIIYFLLGKCVQSNNITLKTNESSHCLHIDSIWVLYFISDLNFHHRTLMEMMIFQVTWCISRVCAILEWVHILLPKFILVQACISVIVCRAETGVDLRSAKAVIHHDGNVFWLLHEKFNSACLIDDTDYPFDSHKCDLWFQSLSYSSDILEIKVNHIFICYLSHRMGNRPDLCQAKWTNSVRKDGLDLCDENGLDLCLGEWARSLSHKMTQTFVNGKGPSLWWTKSW